MPEDPEVKEQEPPKMPFYKGFAQLAEGCQPKVLELGPIPAPTCVAASVQVLMLIANLEGQQTQKQQMAVRFPVVSLRVEPSDPPSQIIPSNRIFGG